MVNRSLFASLPLFHNKGIQFTARPIWYVVAPKIRNQASKSFSSLYRSNNDFLHEALIQGKTPKGHFRVDFQNEAGVSSAMCFLWKSNSGLRYSKLIVICWTVHTCVLSLFSELLDEVKQNTHMPCQWRRADKLFAEAEVWSKKTVRCYICHVVGFRPRKNALKHAC